MTARDSKVRIASFDKERKRASYSVERYFIFAGNKIKAKTFISDLSESDIDGNELGTFTFIGRRVLKRLLHKVHTLILLIYC